MYLRPSTENVANREFDDANAEKSEVIGGDASDSNADDNGKSEDDDLDITNILRYCSEVCTLIGVLSFVVVQQGDEIKNQGLNAFLKQLVTGWMVGACHECFIITSVVLRRLMHRQKPFSSYLIYSYWRAFHFASWAIRILRRQFWCLLCLAAGFC